MRKWVQNLTLIAVSSIVAVMIFEMAIRVVAPRALSTPLGIILDQDVIYRLPPHASGALANSDKEWHIQIDLNNHGFRDFDRSFERVSGTSRVLALGDSFTYGFGVQADERYTNLLEQQLNKISKTEVINVGVPGWGTGQEVRYMEIEGYRYQPDVTLLQFYSGNDLSDVFYGNLFSIEDGRAIAHKVNAERSKKFEYYVHEEKVQSTFAYVWLMSHSHLFQLLRDVYHVYTSSRIFGGETKVRSELEIKKKKNFERDWGITKAVFERLFQQQEKTGKLVVILIPHFHEIELGRSEAIERVAKLCRRWRIPYLNMVPVLMNEVSSGKLKLHDLYWTHDDHFTPAGQALLTEYLIKTLETEDILSVISPKQSRSDMANQEIGNGEKSFVVNGK